MTYYGVPAANEQVTAVFDAYTREVLSYTNQGDFGFKVYALPGIPYKMKLNFKDPQGYYIDNNVDVSIPPRQNLSTTLDLGAFQLLTPDGKGCKGSPDVDCMKNSTLKKGKFVIRAMNAMTGAPEDVEVELRKTHSNSGDLIDSFDVGQAEHLTSLLDYGPYMLKTKSDKFFQLEQPYSLQSSQHKVTLQVVPIPDAGTHRFFMQTNAQSTDYDLNLEFENSKGTTCEVNPLNKYCGYSRMVHDVVKGEQGVETLDIEKFVDANYMLYVSPTPAYSGTCPAYKTA